MKTPPEDLLFSFVNAVLCPLGSQLVQMMDQMRQEFISNSPLPGSYTPRKGGVCAAKFSEDGEWYRAKIERITNKGEEIHVTFMDYGNVGSISSSLIFVDR